MPAVVWARALGEPAAGRSGGRWAAPGLCWGTRGYTRGGGCWPVPGLPGCCPVHLLPLTHTLRLQQTLRVSPGGSQPGRVLGSPVSSQTPDRVSECLEQVQKQSGVREQTSVGGEPTWEVPGLGAATPYRNGAESAAPSFLSGSPVRGRTPWFGC